MSLLSQISGLRKAGAPVRAKGMEAVAAVAPHLDFKALRGVSTGMEIPSLNRSDDIQLVRTDGANPAFLSSLGARRSKSGWWVSRDGRDRFPFEALDPYLPRYAKRNIVPYVVDLIPSTAWHSNLHNILMRSSWDALRAETEAGVGGCQECGIKSGIECHELWDYEQETGVQRLVSLDALCWQCHETRHLGFAQVSGRLEVVFDRLCVANRIRDDERKAYLDLIFGLFSYRSRFEWDLDVSILEGRGLKVKKAVEHLGDGRLRGRAGDRVVDFHLVRTQFEETAKGIILV